ncbi:MAG TPA: HAD family hydrolase [Myxococcales bacterium]
MSIALITFDIFGTVLDWRRGLREALGGNLPGADFDRIVDRQGELEREEFRLYSAIVARSLVEVCGVDPARAARIGADAGRWPLFADSAEAMRRLRTVAPCAATTNSDLLHGDQVRAQLGALDGWICAEEVRAYKPDPAIWQAASRRMGVPFGRDWWHVSAYADYDLATARSLGLTCVLVERPHHRPGPADVVVADLLELARVASGAA